MACSRNRVTITVASDRAVVMIRGWRAADLARGAGLRPSDIGVAGWVLDYGDLGTLVAYLEHRRVFAEIVEERPEPASEVVG